MMQSDAGSAPLTAAAVAGDPLTPALDRSAFERLYRAEWERVLNYARFRVGPAAAHDVAAEVFVRAWSARGSFDPARGTPTTWLWAIVRNEASDGLRERALAPEELPADLVAEDDLVDAGAQALDLARVAWAMERLEPDQREVLALRFGAGYSHREMADLLGIRPGNAAVRLHRAVQQLRRELSEGTER
jgi:RNA polymerase sigma-70 factor (ECF subfamily)